MSRWFKQYRRRRSPHLRLFCFPYAGGSAAVFDTWHCELPDHVDVFAVQAPGRAERFSEPPIALLEDKVTQLHAAIQPFIDVPHVFVGHSNGALTAFELARSLQVSGNTNLKHLVISAKRPPHLPQRKILHRLADDELIRELKSLSSAPTPLLDDRELMQMFMPTLRADLSLSEIGDVRASPRLCGPCTLFHGRHDTYVDAEEMLAWADFVDGPLRLQQFDGGHLFIDTNRTEFVAALRQIVTDVIGVTSQPS